jgi:hypothetical protein
VQLLCILATLVSQWVASRVRVVLLEREQAGWVANAASSFKPTNKAKWMKNKITCSGFNDEKEILLLLLFLLLLFICLLKNKKMKFAWRMRQMDILILTRRQSDLKFDFYYIKLTKNKFDFYFKDDSFSPK